MKEYKVLTQKDKWFSGKFDPQALENALNSYAEQWIKPLKNSIVTRLLKERKYKTMWLILFIILLPVVTILETVKKYK